MVTLLFATLSKPWRYRASSSHFCGAKLYGLPIILVGAGVIASNESPSNKTSRCDQPAPENLYASFGGQGKDSSINKSYPPPPTNGHMEAFRRARDLQYYNDLLVEAKVQVPALRYIRLDSDHRINTSSDRVTARQTNQEKVDNTFYQIANATNDPDLQDHITLLAFEEVLKCMRTTQGSKPIGYDISPLNFMFGVTENDPEPKIYCVDIFPPRLGFDSDGIRPINQCLVNYAEYDFFDAQRLKRLQEAYYTAPGMLRQFVAWFVGTRHAMTKLSAEQAIEESQQLIGKMRRLLQEQFPEETVKSFDEYVQGPQFAKDLSYRLLRCREIWRASMPESVLVVAASGKGSRAKEVLKMNKLAYAIDGTPLVGHVVDAFCQDVRIKHVVFVVNSEDKHLVDSIDTYARSRGIEYSMVLSKPGTGAGYAFYLGMQAAPEGPILLTVGDSVPFNARGVFQTDQPVKIGVIEKGVDQQSASLGKTRTTSKGSRDDKDFSLIGIYYLDANARSKAEAIFKETIRKVQCGNADPSVVNASGEYRFSWLFPALETYGICHGYGDVGSVAEVNFGQNLNDMQTLLKRRQGFFT